MAVKSDLQDLELKKPHSIELLLLIQELQEMANLSTLLELTIHLLTQQRSKSTLKRLQSGSKMVLHQLIQQNNFL